MRPPRDPRGGTAAAVPLGRSILSGSFLGAPSPTRRSPALRARPLCRGAPLSLMGRESHPTVPGIVRELRRRVPVSAPDFSGESLELLLWPLPPPRPALSLEPRVVLFLLLGSFSSLP